MRRFTRLVCAGGMVLAFAPSVAQVRCTMPNGVVIEQRLSSVCPQGATNAQTLDDAVAEVRQPVWAPAKPVLVAAEPVRRGDGGRAVQTVSRAEFGASWPLTVDSVELRCAVIDPSRPAFTGLVFAHNGKIFALNGTASSFAAKMGWFDVRSLWRDNPDIEGTKINISPLIARAQSLCSIEPPAAPAPVPMPQASGDGGGDGMSVFSWLVVGGLVAALIAAIKGSAGVSGGRLFCVSCGHEGPGKTFTRGSIFIEIVLWICFLIPGLIYSIWRQNSKVKICTNCGGKTLVPPNSPVAVATKRSFSA